MAKRINVIGKTVERITDTGSEVRRIDPKDFAAALGAEPVGGRQSIGLDLVSLADIGNALIYRLRSTGGRPSLSDATEIIRVPLSSEDVAALGDIVDAIESTTDSKPSMGQVASIIVRMHLDAVRKDARRTSSNIATNEESTTESIIKGSKKGEGDWSDYESAQKAIQEFAQTATELAERLHRLCD